jgi:ketopantoate reductase
MPADAILAGMTEGDRKADLHGYLRAAREAVLWKLDGLSEYEVRRPLVPTGTNLLGLVEHLATVEWGHFGAAHAGHADIVRELVDGSAGLLDGNDNLAPGDRTWWEGYRRRLEDVARAAGSRS